MCKISDDGDQVSVKPVFTIEGNLDCEKYINSKAYYLDMSGKLMRSITKDFIITAYSLTKTKDSLIDINKVKPKYVV